MNKQGFTFYLIYPFIWLINLFPKLSLALLKPVLFFVLYYLLKYRRKVVKENLERCFNDPLEIKKIEKQYYKHLSHITITPFLTMGFSKKYLLQKVTNESTILEQYYQQGKSVILVMGHCNVWEWLCTTAPFLSPYKPSIVYKKMSNPYFENYINKNRSKYGTVCVEMMQVPRYVMQKIANKEQFIMSFIADQIPSHDNCSIVDFFKNPMYFFNGYERLAQKGNIVLFYVESIMDGDISRFTPQLMVDYSENKGKIDVVQEFAKRLEANILKQPYNWLWSHRRWKRIASKNEN